MKLGPLSGIVLMIAAIYAIRIGIAIFKGFRQESTKGWSRSFDDNLHRVIGGPGDPIGGFALKAMLLVVLAVVLILVGQ